MSNTRIDLLKEVKTSVNSATFAPSEQRIKAAKAAINQLINYVDSLEVPASKPSKKAKKSPKVTKSKSQPKAVLKSERWIMVRRDSVSGMYQVTEGETVLGEYKKRKTARAMATKFSKAEGQPKAATSPKVTKRKAKKTTSSNRRAKLNSNQRLEVRQAKANVAESYIEAPKQSAKQNQPKVAEVPFELSEGQCPIEAARYAKHLAMQEIFDLETGIEDSLIFEEDITFDDLSGQISLF